MNNLFLAIQWAGKISTKEPLPGKGLLSRQWPVGHSIPEGKRVAGTEGEGEVNTLLNTYSAVTTASILFDFHDVFTSSREVNSPTLPCCFEKYVSSLWCWEVSVHIQTTAPVLCTNALPLGVPAGGVSWVVKDGIRLYRDYRCLSYFWKIG